MEHDPRYEILALRPNLSQRRVTVEASSEREARQMFAARYEGDTIVIVFPFAHTPDSCDYCRKVYEESA